MFWRFKWLGVAFAVFFAGFMYRFAHLEMEQASAVHPVLVVFVTVSMLAVLGSARVTVQSGRVDLGGAGLLSLFSGMLLPMFLMHPEPGMTPTRVAPYIFPSWGDYVILGAIALNGVLASLMVFARVPKGKMLIVNGRAYYGGERPVFLPWMKYNVEKFDEIPVKVEFHCAAGTSVVCEAVLVPNVEWCRTNGVFGVNTARFKETAAQIIKRIIWYRVEVRDVNWLSGGGMFDALASIDATTLHGVVEGVDFHCLRFTATVSAMRTPSGEAGART